MNSVRRLLASLAALLALCAGVWAGGGFTAAKAEPAAAQRARVGPNYPGPGADGMVLVGDALAVNGQPMRLSLFQTNDPPTKVATFYAEAFAKRGLVPIAETDAQLGHVSVFDPEDGFQRFVTAVPQPDGQTLVLVGLTDPRRAPRLLRGGAQAPFPLPDEHRAFLGYASDDGGARAFCGQFVTSLPVAAVFAFYRGRLKDQGWVEKADESGPAFALFTKGKASLSVAAQALGNRGGAAVFVNQLEGGL